MVPPGPGCCAAAPGHGSSCVRQARPGALLSPQGARIALQRARHRPSAGDGKKILFQSIIIQILRLCLLLPRLGRVHEWAQGRAHTSQDTDNSELHPEPPQLCTGTSRQKNLYQITHPGFWDVCPIPHSPTTPCPAQGEQTLTPVPVVPNFSPTALLRIGY